MAAIPMHRPRGFEVRRAVLCTRLVNLAYAQYAAWKAQDEPEPEDFHWRPAGDRFTFGEPIWGRSGGWLIRDREPFGFVARDRGDNVFLVLRGTQSGADWLSNLHADLTRYRFATGYGRAHEGFYRLWRTMRDQVKAQLTAGPIRPRLTICGHSLGAALTTLAVPDILRNTGYSVSAGHSILHYSLAAPRAGNVTFAQRYNANGVPTFRVVNTEDIVPNAPPAILGDNDFCHVGAPAAFTAQYGSIVGNHSSEEAYLHALENPDAPWKNV